MILTDEELARIPICPRAGGARPYTKPVTFLVETDAAVMAIARMVVAGVDKKYNLHPHYDALVRIYGKKKAHKSIAEVVTLAGAVDIIQTDPSYGGIGLFGGLSQNHARFTFQEWSEDADGQLTVSMTRQEARDIVSGEKKTIVFRPHRYQVRLCIDQMYTKDRGVWSLPSKDYEAGENGEQMYPDKFRVIINRKPYELWVKSINWPSLPAHDKRIHIFLEEPAEAKTKIQEALARDPGWKLQSRSALLV